MAGFDAYDLTAYILALARRVYWGIPLYQGRHQAVLHQGRIGAQ